MSLRDQLQRLRRKGAEFRLEADSITVLFYLFNPSTRTVDANGQPLEVIQGHPVQTERLVDGGWQVEVTSTIRYLRAGADSAPPTRGSIVEIPQGSGLAKKYTVEQVHNNINQPEIVLGLKET